MLRKISDFMDRGAVETVDARLRQIAAEEQVIVPIAIESGSRAWDFPSPDSDYDCRFIFVRTAKDYLSLFPKRDVIETPPDGIFDVNGWDIGKSLRLLLKGNAVVIEWLTSPIVYAADVWFRDEFRALARRVVVRESVAKHYLHLGERQRRAYFSDETEVPLKKVFYALRPAAALRWLRLHPDETVVPMHLQTLMAECDAPDEIQMNVRDLVEKKAVTHELGSDVLPRPIAAFIDSEFALARECFGDRVRPVREQAEEDADAFFRAALARFGTGRTACT